MLQRTMLTMKEQVAVLEAQLQERCAREPSAHLLQHKLMTLALEATTLRHGNYELSRALDAHEFFHAMLQLEYDHVRSVSTATPAVLSLSLSLALVALYCVMLLLSVSAAAAAVCVCT